MTPGAIRDGIQHRPALKRPSSIHCAMIALALSGAAWDAGSAAPAPADAPPLVAGRSNGDVQPTPRSSEAIDRELFAPDPTPRATPGPKRAIDPAAIVEQMLQSARRLGKIDSGPGTQQVQRRILEDLEAILRHAEKAPSDSTASGQKTAQKAQPGMQPKTAEGDPNAAQTQPGAQSNAEQADGAGKSAQGDARGPDSRVSLLRRVWGDLPERQRDEILQLQPPEEFLPEYEVEIEAYFRRLAESGGEKGEGGGGKGK